MKTLMWSVGVGPCITMAHQRRQDLAASVASGLVNAGNKVTEPIPISAVSNSRQYITVDSHERCVYIQGERVQCACGQGRVPVTGMEVPRHRRVRGNRPKMPSLPRSIPRSETCSPLPANITAMESRILPGGAGHQRERTDSGGPRTGPGTRAHQLAMSPRSSQRGRSATGQS